MAAKDFIALDVETANADLASICAIGLAHFRGGSIFRSLTILVDPEDEFDQINVGIHGIRPEDVAGKPTMDQVFPAISHSLGDVIVVQARVRDIFQDAETSDGQKAILKRFIDAPKGRASNV